MSWVSRCCVYPDLEACSSWCAVRHDPCHQSHVQLHCGELTAMITKPSLTHQHLNEEPGHPQVLEAIVTPDLALLVGWIQSSPVYLDLPAVPGIFGARMDGVSVRPEVLIDFPPQRGKQQPPRTFCKALEVLMSSQHVCLRAKLFHLTCPCSWAWFGAPVSDSYWDRKCVKIHV